MGLYRPVRAIVDPLVATTYPVPKSAILPLVLLIFGLGEASKIAMVALGVFYPMIINTMAGVSRLTGSISMSARISAPADGRPFARSRCPAPPH